MRQFEAYFQVNGRLIKTVIQATDSLAARRMVEAQYSGNKLMIFYVKEI